MDEAVQWTVARVVQRRVLEGVRLVDEAEVQLQIELEVLQLVLREERHLDEEGERLPGEVGQLSSVEAAGRQLGATEDLSLEVLEVRRLGGKVVELWWEQQRLWRTRVVSSSSRLCPRPVPPGARPRVAHTHSTVWTALQRSHPILPSLQHRSTHDIRTGDSPVATPPPARLSVGIPPANSPASCGGASPPPPPPPPLSALPALGTGGALNLPPPPPFAPPRAGAGSSRDRPARTALSVGDGAREVSGGPATAGPLLSTVLAFLSLRPAWIEARSELSIPIGAAVSWAASEGVGGEQGTGQRRLCSSVCRLLDVPPCTS